MGSSPKPDLPPRPNAAKVGEVARLARVTVRTLHHYDRIGLLVPSGRAANGYRLYSYEQAIATQRLDAKLRGMSARNPGFVHSFAGERREISESMGALGRGFALALLAIHALLAIPFRSASRESPSAVAAEPLIAASGTPPNPLPAGNSLNLFALPNPTL